MSLRETSSDFHQSSFQNKIKPDDVLFIRNPTLPMPHSYIGRVIDLIVEENGNIRSVKLMRGNRSDVLNSLKHIYTL